jgi:hypothetical protein
VCVRPRRTSVYARTKRTRERKIREGEPEPKARATKSSWYEERCCEAKNNRCCWVTTLSCFAFISSSGSLRIAFKAVRYCSKDNKIVFLEQ